MTGRGVLAHDAAERLVPYVPALALDWLRTDPSCRHRSLEATIVFVDVSGFTALTERLATRGKAGAEEVSDVIGGAFVELLEVAGRHGGELLKWGGDAALLLFHGDGAPRRACRAAWLMSKMMTRIGKVRTSVGRVALGVSAGVHTGPIDLFLLGDLHRELVITGPGASMVAALEHAADSGEVLIGHSTAAAVDRRVWGEEKGPGVLLRAAPESGARGRTEAGHAAGPGDGAGPSVDAESGRLAGQLLSAAVRNHLLGGGEPAEHRFAAAAFIEFSGVDRLYAERGPAAVAAALDPVIGSCQLAAEHYGVTFHYSDIGADGGKMLLAGGVPVVRGEDETRLLRTARRVVGDHDGPLQLRAGLNAGRFFVHDAGRPERRVYSFSGDAVNLAARVMGRAPPGEVLATDTFLARVRTGVRTRPLPPFLVKGKRDPVVASSVLGFVEGETTGPDDQVAFVGRLAELSRLLRAATRAQRGTGSVVDVVAEPGIGKTRLAAEAAALWPLETCRVVCESYGDTVPYVPFRHLLRALLGAGPDSPASAVTEALHAFVGSHAPSLLPWLPLLGSLLDVPTSPTAEVDRLDPRFRRERLEEVTIALLDALVSTPTALLFEDVHAADEATRSLLARLASAVDTRPWLVVVTRRPEEEPALFPDARWVEQIRLGALNSAEASALLEGNSDELALLPHERRLLLERAAGSPLFLRELLEAFRVTRSVEALPDSLESLLVAQVDRLAPGDRSVLRAAAVLGARFDVQILSDVLGPPAQLDPDIWRRLDAHVQDEMTGRKEFRHALLRDAAYEGLSFRRRRTLHGRAAEAIERRSTSPDDAGLLSLHFLHAESFPETWRYACVGGDRAAALYAHTEAAVLYRRALAAARRVPSIPGAEVAQVWERLGDASELAGQYASAAEAFAAAGRALAAPADRARLLRKAGVVHERNARYRAALSCYTRGRNLVGPGAGRSRAEAVEHCELTIAPAGVRFRQGRYLECLRWAEAAATEATEIDHRTGLAHALYLEDMALDTLGRPSGDVAQRALEVYEALGDLVGQGNVLNNVGIKAYFRGRWPEALDLYRRSQQAREQAGDVAGAAASQNNIAEILSDQGHAEGATVLFDAARRSWSAAGYQVGLALVTSNLGRLAARRGRCDEAAGLLREAAARFASIGASVYEHDTEARRIEMELLAGRGAGAGRDAERLLARVGTLDGADALEALVRRLLGLTRACDGDVEGAVVELERSVARAGQNAEMFELALGLAALAGTRPHDGSPSAPAVAEAHRAVALLTSLGVVDVPVRSLEDRWPAAAALFPA